MQINNLDIHWLGQSGFSIKSDEKIIYIDPFKISEEFEEEKADIILISHPHYDHCSPEDIKKISKHGTVIVCPADCQSKIARLDEEIKLEILDVGKTISVFGIGIGGVPAYNPEKNFHPKSERWLGYLIKFPSGETIYHAGDTDLIPEMKKLYGKVKIALLPIGGNYTMNAKEAADSAALIKPGIAIPMHYRDIVGSDADAEEFKKLCFQNGIRSEIL